MVASEKAKELIYRFWFTEIDKPGDIESITFDLAKKCAILLCRDMIYEYTHQLLLRGAINKSFAENMVEYWISVIEEIEKHEK